VSGTPDAPEATYDDYVEADDAPASAIRRDNFVADDDDHYDEHYDDDDSDNQTREAQTLEDLERQFSASGFTHIETRHGLLAELERGQQAGDVAGVAMPPEPPTDDEPARDGPSGGDAPARAPGVRGPDPRDYPARLTRARQRRDGGQLDEALSEYRVIIKNAPDLLPDVLDDLYASLAELPDHPNLHSVLGDALVCQGEYEKALESYNKAMELAQARSGQS
jgi:tetratricopeptide (TPR) repeat protein